MVGASVTAVKLHGTTWTVHVHVHVRYNVHVDVHVQCTGHAWSHGSIGLRIPKPVNWQERPYNTTERQGTRQSPTLHWFCADVETTEVFCLFVFLAWNLKIKHTLLNCIYPLKWGTKYFNKKYMEGPCFSSYGRCPEIRNLARTHVHSRGQLTRRWMCSAAIFKPISSAVSVSFVCTSVDATAVEQHVQPGANYTGQFGCVFKYMYCECEFPPFQNIVGSVSYMQVLRCCT